jgi:hypothetical protein
MLINFYEITINEEVRNLYVSNRLKIGQSDGLFVKLSQDSFVTLEPNSHTHPISSNIKQLLNWLIGEYFFKNISESKCFFDLNKRAGEFAILDEKLFRNNYLSILRTVTIRFYEIKGRFFLSILPKTGIYNRLSLSKLRSQYNFSINHFLNNNRALIYVEREGVRGWFTGIIKSIDTQVKVEIPLLFNGTILVDSNRVIPKLKQLDYNFDPSFHQSLTKLIQLHSHLSSKDILNTANLIVKKYLSPAFSLPFGKYCLSLRQMPLDTEIFKIFDLKNHDKATNYIFTRGSKIITDSARIKGLSRFDLSDSFKSQNIVLFGTKQTIGIIRSLINSLNNGIRSGNYNFDIKTRFGIELNVVDEYVTENYDEYLDEANKFIFSTEDKHKNALAIAYLPENSGLYYQFKAKLASGGKVSQIRSKTTLDIYTAWNISANIFAKLGFTPWTIFENQETENADLILGFSYSSLNRDGKLRRNIGYVNVFDKNGEWKFMRTHSGILDFDNRLKIIPELVQEAVYAYMGSGMKPHIIDIHYSKRFSQNERRKVFEAILKLIPDVIKVNFISIDDSHTVRVFDTDKVSMNLDRGKVLFIRDNEFILSVLSNEKDVKSYKQIKVIVHTEGQAYDIKNMLFVAERILTMTKLNWRSVVKDSSEPVTIKYSNEIAKLTNHFSLTEWSGVANNLSNIPWFI